MPRDDRSLGGRIDEICERFEQELMDGKSPRLEDYLQGFHEPAATELLAALASIEVEYRKRKRRQSPES